jgi:hypothetical protein
MICAFFLTTSPALTILIGMPAALAIRVLQQAQQPGQRPEALSQGRSERWRVARPLAR